MKKMTLFSMIMLLGWQTVNALTVNVNGYGEVPSQGLEITCDKAQKDPLTEKNVMEIKGDLLCSGSLSVSITRSSEALVDEFCCATQCTTGNGNKNEQLSFTISGVTSWYVHHTPADQSYETVTYSFSDGTESRIVTVHYDYNNAEENEIPASFPKKHLIEEFTGQDCGYCPSGMEGVSTFMKEDDNYVLIMHHYGFAPDNFSVAGSATITNKLQVTGAPSSTIDRNVTNVYNISSVLFHPANMPVVDKSQFAATTYASVNIENTYNAQSKQLNVHVSGAIAKTDYPALKLTVLVKESGMIDYQKDYYNTFEGWEQFRHISAVRAYLTEPLGNEVTVDETRHYSADLSLTLDGKWIPENCMVVAFLSEDFDPVVQVAEQPVVSGTKGGADIEHKGLKAVPVADYYPEPSATASPKDYTNQDVEELAVAVAERENYSNFSYWTISAYSEDRIIKVNNEDCLPFVRMYIFTELSQTIINGSYDFSTNYNIGLAQAGERDDAKFSIVGSQFYLASYSYLKQGYLVPREKWLISEGTLTIDSNGWSVNAKARNGQKIILKGTSPIDYEGKPATALQSVADDNIQTSKIIVNGQLLIQRGDKVYNISGMEIK